jgi:SET domain-containing protein
MKDGLKSNEGPISPETMRGMSPDRYTPRTRRYSSLKKNEGAPDKRLKLEVAPIEGKGSGVITKKKINKELFPVVEYTGMRRRIGLDPQMDRASQYLVRLDKTKGRYVLDASQGGSIGRYINGIDGPWDEANVKMWESQEGRVYIYTTRPINAGEELKLDYGPDFYTKVYNTVTNRIDYKYN